MKVLFPTGQENLHAIHGRDDTSLRNYLSRLSHDCYGALGLEEEDFDFDFQLRKPTLIANFQNPPGLTKLLLELFRDSIIAAQ